MAPKTNTENTRKENSRVHQEAWTPHSGQPLTHIEYNIYSYSNDDSPRACWQKCGSADKAESAIIHAERLFRSGQFIKVEVKQKYFDSKARRNVDQTWKVFERRKAIRLSSKSVAFAGISAIVAFVATYILTTI